MRLSFMTFACPEYTLQEVISAAKRFAYEGVEPRVTAGHKHGIEPDADVSTRASARSAFADSGIEIACVATSCRFATADPAARAKNRDNLKVHVQLAADLGASRGRALTAAGIPSFKVSCGGDQAQFLAASLHLRGPNLYGAKYVVSNYGINDVFHPRTLDQIKADLQKIWAYFAARGAKVFQTTLTPRTSSTDFFYSLANQTVTAQESVRLGVNNWLRDASASGAVAQSGGALAGVFDVSPYCETDGKWAPYATFLYSGTPTSYGANWIEDTTVTGWPGNTAHSLNHGAGLAIIAGTGMGTFYAANENSPGNKFYATSGNFSPALDATSRYGLFWTPTNDGIHPNWKANIAMMAAINTSLLV